MEIWKNFIALSEKKPPLTLINSKAKTKEELNEKLKDNLDAVNEAVNERINDLTAKNNECINEIGELKDKSLDIEEKVDSLKSGKLGSTYQVHT